MFVAGFEPKSALAVANLVRLCNTHLPGQYQIHTFDVMKSIEAANAQHVLVTPTVILISPLPQVTLYGTLSDPAQVLAALRLTGQ